MDDSQSNDDADFLDEYFAIDESIGTYEEQDDLFDGPECQQATSASKMDAGKQAGKPDNTYELFNMDPDDDGAADDDQEPTRNGTSNNHWASEEFDIESIEVAGNTIPDEQGLTDELAALMNGCDENEPITNGANLAANAPANDDYGVIEFEQSGPFILDDGDGLWAEDLANDDPQDALVGEQPNIDLILERHEEELMSSRETSSTPTPNENIAGPAPKDGQFIPEIDATLDDLFFLEEEALSLETAAEEFASEAEADVTTPSHEADSDDPLSCLNEVSTESSHEANEDLYENMPLMPSSPFRDDGSSDQAGWEPLPAKSIDQLSEIEGVERTDTETRYEPASPDLQEFAELQDDDYEDTDYVHAEADSAEYEEDEYDDEVFADDHEIYEPDGENEEPPIGGVATKPRMTPRALIMLAASLAVALGAIATALTTSPLDMKAVTSEVALAELPRPKVQISVNEPPPVPVGTALISDVTLPATANPSTSDQDLEANDSTSTATRSVITTPLDGMVAAGASPKPTRTTESAPPRISPTEQTPAAGLPATNAGQVSQIAAMNGIPTPSRSQTNETATLARFGERLLVGGFADHPQSTNAIDAVMLGSRALAQLHNGNYFVGQVKRVADMAITLRVATGELTIAKTEIAQITPLGADDYEQLQQASKGVVRLTNNNRLIGGILSQIADDHVVLEFRKNRVILPKSEIGEIVAGDQNGNDVRLGTTDVEDSWVRNLAKRQLGTGKAQPQHDN